jgi:hypothetical protein
MSNSLCCWDIRCCDVAHLCSSSDAAISKLQIRQSQNPKKLHEGSSEHCKATLKGTRLDLEYHPSTNATLMYQIDQSAVEALM